jgi:hypothetical protein
VSFSEVAFNFFRSPVQLQKWYAIHFRSGVQQACSERHLRAVTARETAGIPPVSPSKQALLCMAVSEDFFW